MSQTLEAVFKEQQAVFSMCGIRGGWRVAELGISLVTFGLADPWKFDLGSVIDNDIIARPHME